MTGGPLAPAALRTAVQLRLGMAATELVALSCGDDRVESPVDLAQCMSTHCGARRGVVNVPVHGPYGLHAGICRHGPYNHLRHNSIRDGVVMVAREIAGIHVEPEGLPSTERRESSRGSIVGLEGWVTPMPGPRLPPRGPQQGPLALAKDGRLGAELT